MPTNTKESGFEALIVNWLVEHNGYEEGSNADYKNTPLMRLGFFGSCRIRNRSN